jgi:hypothetical protein
VYIRVTTNPSSITHTDGINLTHMKLNNINKWGGGEFVFGFFYLLSG